MPSCQSNSIDYIIGKSYWMKNNVAFLIWNNWLFSYVIQYSKNILTHYLDEILRAILSTKTSFDHNHIPSPSKIMHITHLKIC